MSLPFGVTVTTAETSQSAGTSTSTGTAFIVGIADQGVTTPVLVRSMSQYIAQYGPRTVTSSILYDEVETFFQIGEAQCYVLRVSNESAKPAKKALLDAGNKPTVVVTFKTAGTAGNNYKIETVTSGTETEAIILNSENEVLENSGRLTQANLLLFKSAYVEYTQSAEAEFTKNIPKTLAATALTGGENPTGLADANFDSALPLFVKTFGPGQVMMPERTSTTAHNAMLTHCKENNRFALCDIADSSVVATLIANKGSQTAGLAGYGMYTGSSVTIQGLTLGTTRTVKGSAVVAGLLAQVSKTGNDNQAPAGREWPLPPFVLGFTNTFSLENMKTLNEAGINSWAERGGTLCLYGFSTALPSTTDVIFWQASASRERMSLVAAAEIIGERFQFKTIDGRKQLLSKFQGELQGLGARHYAANALFGENAAEACLVNVSEPVNTLATMQAGELNAEMIVRISPFAQAVNILIVSTPITSAV
jgi:hypothetical protein